MGGNISNRSSTVAFNKVKALQCLIKRLNESFMEAVGPDADRQLSILLILWRVCDDLLNTRPGIDFTRI